MIFPAVSFLSDYICDVLQTSLYLVNRSAWRSVAISPAPEPINAAIQSSIRSPSGGPTPPDTQAHQYAEGLRSLPDEPSSQTSGYDCRKTQRRSLLCALRKQGSQLEKLVVYGESSPVNYVNAHSTQIAVTCCPVPIEPSDKVRTESSASVREVGHCHPAQTNKAAKLEQMSRDGVFEIPSAQACDILFKAYFEWFHMCYPILDRVMTDHAYSQMTLSPLVFHSVLFIGVTLCKEKDLRDAGIPDRHAARFEFFHKAKDVFDSGLETDAFSILQGLFLMSFWHGGPCLEKDTRYWLGAAIGLAQAKGLHLSYVSIRPLPRRRGSKDFR